MPCELESDLRFIRPGNKRRGRALFKANPLIARCPDMPTATLTRMVLPDHTCPFGVRAKAMLEEAGYTVDDHILDSREAVDAFEEEHNVSTTPLIEIDGEVIGGSDDLERWLATKDA